jgi:hypothetical protein
MHCMTKPSTKVSRAAKQLVRALDRGEHWADAFRRVCSLFNLDERQGRRTLARVSEVDPRAAELIELELGSELDPAYHT